MADVLKGIWKQNHGSYSSGDSDTESETEISSIYGVGKSGEVRPCTTPQYVDTAVCNNGKNDNEGSVRNGSAAAKLSRKRNGEMRMPTRRPDPNVLNRNALLARENRRKKKMYLESVENELHDARRANRALVKALKRQVKLTQRLEEEKRYFQNILANQTEISHLVTSFNKSRQISIDQQSTSSLEVFSESTSHREPLTSCCSSSSSYDPEPLQSPFGAASHDLDTDMTPGNFSHSSWDDIWNSEPPTATLTQLEEGAEQEQTLKYPHFTTLGKENVNNSWPSIDDHNYVTSPERQQPAIDMPSLSPGPSSSSPTYGNDFPGICLHLTRGKISLEFCPTCHISSSGQDPPLQLLNDVMLA